jgi:exosortase
MTENQTNPPSDPNPNMGGSQDVPGTPRKRHGHFASDGLVHRRTVPASPAMPITPAAAPAPQFGPHPGARGAEFAAASAVIPPVPKRFEAGERKPIATKQTSLSKPPVRSIPAVAVRLPVDLSFERFRLFLLTVCLVPLCIWGSYPAWGSMVYEWWHTDDYSHGFIVIPATILFLYMRWDSYPGTRYKLDWVGLFPITLYGVARIFAGMRYMDPLDAVAIWFWILSLVWFFYGWRVFLWALPSLCFLVFMFQLPWRVDVLMKNYLQLFAAQFAATLLQLVGIAAIPIKNTIQLRTMELGVEAACSGLRFLMSVFAIAFAAVLLLRRPWWQNVMILAIAAPLALFVNAVRIAITGFMLVHFNDMVAAWAEGGTKSVGVVADEFAGKIAIALALGLFALFVWYLGKIFRQVEI